MKKTRMILALSLAAIFVATCAVPAYAGFKCTVLDDSKSTSINCNGVPFEYNALYMLVLKHEAQFEETKILDLSGLKAEMIHVIEAAAWSDNVPDGVAVGEISVFYQDGSSTSLDLVMGKNIAEWAWNRPEAKGLIQHSYVTPAFSYDTNLHSTETYQGMKYSVCLDTEPKLLDYLELKLLPEAYTNQQGYGLGPADSFGIAIQAVTLETVPEPATIAILALGGLVLLRSRR